MAAANEKVQLYLAHRGALVEYALPIVGDRMRADDVVQEAFIRFAPDKALIGQPLGYLYRIVRNLAYGFTRRALADWTRFDVGLRYTVDNLRSPTAKPIVIRFGVASLTFRLSTSVDF